MHENILENPNLMDSILEKSESKAVGNEKVKKHVLLACCSTFNLNPDYTFNLTLQQESGLGKSTVAKSIVRLFPEDKVLKMSRMSEKALFHMEEPLDRKIVFIEEMSGNDASYGTKIAISEHQLTSRTVEKVAGSFKTQHKHVSMVGTSFITTTTKQPYDKELESRVLRVYTENSESYITQVLDSIKQDVRDVMKPEPALSDNLEDIRKALSELQIYPVKIPFTDEIIDTNLYKDIANPFRITKIILAMVQARALLYQKQREIKDGYLIAQPADYINIRDLVEDVVNPPDPELIQLKERVGESEFNASNVENIFGVRQSQAYKLLKRFRERGVITGARAGKYKVHNILLPEIEKSPPIPHVPPVPKYTEYTNEEEGHTQNTTHSTDSTSSDYKNDKRKARFEELKKHVGNGKFTDSDIRRIFNLNHEEAYNFVSALLNEKLVSYTPATKNTGYYFEIKNAEQEPNPVISNKDNDKPALGDSSDSTSSRVYKESEEEPNIHTKTVETVETVEKQKEEESPQEWILHMR